MTSVDRELPLFPLKRVVLFPGMPLPLHIFEERYKIMLASCQVSAEPFGVVLIRSGDEVGAPARPERVGCTARLVKVDRFPDGTMDILSVGEHRFALQGAPRVTPEGYLVGESRITTAEDVPADVSRALLEEVVSEFKAYWAELMQRARKGSTAAPELPSEPIQLSFRVAAALAVDPLEQQQLLVTDDVKARLERELALLRRENRPGRMIGPFSVN
jgi:Lon protease-like protein